MTAPRLTLALLTVGTLAAPSALANPRPMPFTYGYSTQPKGGFEIEQYADLVPVRIAKEGDGGTEAVTSLRSVLQTELEYGISDRLEFGWYFAFKQAASTSPSLAFDGVKQRLRLRLAEAGDWPVDVALYLEMAEFHDELEFEQKIILSRRFGIATLAANLWVEQEWAFQEGEWEFIYNPTVATTFEVSPHVTLGLEYWARGHFGEGDAHHYLGPTVLLQSGEYWLTLGAYARLDDISEGAVVGDDYGKVWIRAIVGIGL
ncbi:MAG: hypothetical protein H6744_08220 [Deltaproteobacteria bacterium]|nr:hypothetical protein [Deltaproteobacteria bacterium]MCB9786663.1 hypothetical protein [Deltaproteobacteria bacterium]